MVLVPVKPAGIVAVDFDSERNGAMYEEEGLAELSRRVVGMKVVEEGCFGFERDVGE